MDLPFDDLATATNGVFAYINQGSGSMILQTLVGGLLGLLYLVKQAGARLKALVLLKKHHG